MPRDDESIINFALYEDANEYLGMAEVALPELVSLTQEITGAGIAGNVEAVILGHFEAMTTTLNFRTVTRSAVSLNKPGYHTLTLRVAQQLKDTVKGTKVVQAVKHVMIVESKKYAPGKVAPASSAEASGEYAVTYFATFIDGKKVLEIDKLNFIYEVDGVDYLADARKAMGK